MSQEGGNDPDRNVASMVTGVSNLPKKELKPFSASTLPQGLGVSAYLRGIETVFSACPLLRFFGSPAYLKELKLGRAFSSPRLHQVSSLPKR